MVAITTHALWKKARDTTTQSPLNKKLSILAIPFMCEDQFGNECAYDHSLSAGQSGMATVHGPISTYISQPIVNSPSSLVSHYRLHRTNDYSIFKCSDATRTCVIEGDTKTLKSIESQRNPVIVLQYLITANGPNILGAYIRTDKKI